MRRLSQLLEPIPSNTNIYWRGSASREPARLYRARERIHRIHVNFCTVFGLCFSCLSLLPPLLSGDMGLGRQTLFCCPISVLFLSCVFAFSKVPNRRARQRVSRREFPKRSLTRDLIIFFELLFARVNRTRRAVHSAVISRRFRRTCAVDSNACGYGSGRSGCCLLTPKQPPRSLFRERAATQELTLQAGAPRDIRKEQKQGRC